MDIDSLAKGIGLISSALTTLKQMANVLPNNSKKADVIANLEKAEREFKNAEAETATGLGYEICRQHFPPVIMLSKDDEIWECPECHNIKRPGDYVDKLTKYYTP
jgi:hypothetical protein